MTRRARRIRRTLIVVVATSVLAAIGFFVSPSSTAATGVTIEGHGYGHGRGMGQWGAYGYARAGWTHEQILGHYYRNTAFGSTGNAAMNVRMDEVTGPVTVMSNPQGGGFHVDAEGRTLVTSSYGCVRARAVSIGVDRWRVECAPLFQDFTTLVAANVAGPVIFLANRWIDPVTDAVQLAVPAGWRYLRGHVRAQWFDGAPRAINVIGLESFLRGTVAAEMPSTWGPNGGQAALEAQAVAARTYALTVRNWNRGRGAAWDTCTSTCQAYGGFRLNDRMLEAGPVDAAVAATAGKIVTFNGAPILAEYSASTGGYSAPGLASQPWFQPVRDDGDAVPGNPNHNWTVSLSPAQIQGAWPQIGTFVSMVVTARNGYGDWGGRVTKMVVRGTVGEVTVTGETMRNKFGFKSDWFHVVGTPDIEGAIPTDPPLGPRSTDRLRGYWLAARDGAVYTYGGAPNLGSMAGKALNQPVVDMARTRYQDGYWLVAADGGVFTFGTAPFLGGTGGMRLNAPVLGIERRLYTNGYWLLARDGGVFAFGAPFFGSTGSMRLNAPVISMASSATGNGYWLLAEDGGVFTFGDAPFKGSLAGRATSTAVKLVPTSTGNGYWIITRDGNIASFGDAVPVPASTSSALQIAGADRTRSNLGLVLADASGGTKQYGDAPRLGGPRDVNSTWPGRIVSVVGFR